MNLRKLHKGWLIGGLVVLAIGGMALAAPQGRDSTGSVSGEYAADEGDLPGKIDGLLRSSQESRPDAQTSKTIVQAAPAQRDSGGASGSPPVAPPVPGSAPAEPSGMTSDRKIVQTASIRLQVKEVGASFEEVSRVATASGGFVASSNFSFQGEQQVASATIRVPAQRYQEVLSQLRSLGAKVDSEGSNANDITEEYSDLQARLRNYEATETQLLTFMTQARNVSEVLQVQDRLNNVRNEIERAKGRMNLLDKLSDLATITVHLRPVVGSSGGSEGGSGIGAEITRAWEDSLDFLGGIATTVVTAIVFVWWLPIVAVPAYAAWRRFGRGMSPQAQVAAHD
jgi:hypothetical protein